MTAFEKKKLFLINNPLYLKRWMSEYFSFTWQQLRKYQYILDWKVIQGNTKIKWSAGVIREFKNLFSAAIIPSEGFDWLGTNRSVPWSIELIEEFKGYWDWEFISYNAKIVGDARMRNHFSAELSPFLTEEHVSDMIDENFGFGECSKVHFGEDIVRLYIECGIKFKERIYQTIDEIESGESIDWGILSSNLLLPWSIELIEKYQDKWDWRTLCRNEMIPWDEKLIGYFKDKIVWGEWGELDFYCKRIYVGLSNNRAIKWDSKLINRYKDKLEFREITRNKGAKWDIDLLIEFQDLWDYEALFLNNVIWSKVFPEFNDSKILEILDIILKNKIELKPVFKMSFEKN
ncbi:MAG: hypothetical protein ABIT08_17595 [Bacteroidia bacterium]